MKRPAYAIIITGIILVSGYWIYKEYLLPRMVARAILREEEPGFLPKGIKRRLDRSKKKINTGLDTVLAIVHSRHITLEQVLKSIDGVSEEQVYAFLDELNRTEIESSNQVFDIGKKHFIASFDEELLREPFTRKVSVTVIKRFLLNANKQRNNPEIDPETIRSVFKQLVIEKEAQYKKEILANPSSTLN